MQRIDFYVQHLMRHNASSIELVSGEPVKFELATGVRHSNKPIEHAQIAQLVQEAAPPAALEGLRSAGRAEFMHASPVGLRVQVSLSARGPGAWTVRMGPAPEAAPAAAAVESIPLPPQEPRRAPAAPRAASAGRPGEAKLNR
ncbi:MAG: hypothetical protein AAF447_26490, partial [Myxococcota bacterium]